MEPTGPDNTKMNYGGSQKTTKMDISGGTNAKAGDKAGVEFGLSARSTFSTKEGFVKVDTKTQRVTDNPVSSSVSGKGKSFTIC